MPCLRPNSRCEGYARASRLRRTFLNSKFELPNIASQSTPDSIVSISSADMPVANEPPMSPPMLVPAMTSIGMWCSSSQRMTPTCAIPRALPPPRATPTFGRGAAGGDCASAVRPKGGPRRSRSAAVARDAVDRMGVGPEISHQIRFPSVLLHPDDCSDTSLHHLREHHRHHEARFEAGRHRRTLKLGSLQLLVSRASFFIWTAVRVLRSCDPSRVHAGYDTAGRARISAADKDLHDLHHPRRARCCRRLRLAGASLLPIVLAQDTGVTCRLRLTRSIMGEVKPRSIRSSALAWRVSRRWAASSVRRMRVSGRRPGHPQASCG